ncbi:MAG: NUDIX domain-containing protein [Anaerolineaceae bacterium]|nr:NUDIX domain-containing protein [Anaerolineaceae bacterium]
MMPITLEKHIESPIIQRVRAILLTERGTLLFIKRVKPGSAPYWVAPGGGVEQYDPQLVDALHRELCEELGATVEVVQTGFILKHEKAGKNLEEHFFICRLVDYDLDLRHGPEFDDPSRGEYIPAEIPLDVAALKAINMKTIELQDWLVEHLPDLRQLAG